jgi:hypothetical protein
MVRRNLPGGARVAIAAALIAMQTAAVVSAQTDSTDSSNPTAVCDQYSLLNRLDCQDCIRQGQPRVRCEAQAFLGTGPLNKSFISAPAPKVLDQFPVATAAPATTAIQPNAFPTLAPPGPQLWGLLPQMQAPGVIQAQPIESNAITKAQVSTWCKAFNAANGIADNTLKVSGAAELLGLSAGQAESVAETARAAAANRTLIFLVAAGAAVYMVSQHCAPATP